MDMRLGGRDGIKRCIYVVIFSYKVDESLLHYEIKK